MANTTQKITQTYDDDLLKTLFEEEATKTDIEELQEQIDTLDAYLTGLKTYTYNLNDALSTVQTEQSTMQTTLNNVQLNMPTITNNITKLQKQADTAEAELNGLQTDNATNKTDIATLKSKNAKVITGTYNTSIDFDGEGTTIAIGENCYQLLIVDVTDLGITTLDNVIAIVQVNLTNNIGVGYLDSGDSYMRLLALNGKTYLQINKVFLTAGAEMTAPLNVKYSYYVEVIDND